MALDADFLQRARLAAAEQLLELVNAELIVMQATVTSMTVTSPCSTTQPEVS
jgi:hypothetical protein